MIGTQTGIAASDIRAIRERTEPKKLDENRFCSVLELAAKSNFL